jgi:deoxyribose-phosphate aldolase
MSALAQNDKLVEKISAAILAAVNPPVSGYDAAGEEHSAAGTQFSLQQIAAMIDHTLLKPDATRAQIVQLCAEARQAGFASVCINPGWVPLCAQELAGSAVKVCTVIGFPLGANMTEIKVAEAKLAVAQGASEVDMVLNIGALKGGETDLVKADIQAVAEAAHAGGALLKVILETFFLNDDQKVAACRLSQQAGADYVKTSTGFLGGGATVHDIALMRRTVGSALGVKASGGVRTYEDAVAMIQAGASRIGASAGLKIIQGPSQPATGEVAALPKLDKQQVDTLVRQVLGKLA